MNLKMAVDKVKADIGKAWQCGDVRRALFLTDVFKVCVNDSTVLESIIGFGGDSLTRVASDMIRDATKMRDETMYRRAISYNVINKYANEVSKNE